MRILWRLWLRPGLFKTIVFIFTFLSLALLLIQSPTRYQPPSEVSIRDQPSSAKSQIAETDLVPTGPSVESDPIHLPNSDWLPIEHSNREVFVYSAYLDRRKSQHYVRVIAIVRRRKKVQFCELTYGNITRRVSSKVKMIRENWNLLYSAAYILCEIPPDNKRPDTVALVDNNKVDKTSVIPVQITAERAHHGNMSACIKPFHYEFNRAVWLVEFIELYQLLGTNHFIFYNHTVGPDVQKVLEYYQDEGIVTVLPWALPVKSQKEIRTEGIFAALNDCSFRSIKRFHYAAMVDVDEYLVPRGYANLIDLIRELGVYDVYIFQNVFYYLYWENDTAIHDTFYGNKNERSLGYSLLGEEDQFPYLLTAYKTRRLTKVHKPGTRSKYIVRPEQVVEVGNHNVWEHVGK
ncbi:hypothetical protein SK128_003921 [Halocaridina rubra]|uniref:Glycosyltransferase family 92 protein n=1 Tax=Halocaridina rubra TaxID=373956 RepID=A0AAN8WY24_HALRR